MNQRGYCVMYAHRSRPDQPTISVIRYELDAINAVIGSRKDNMSWLGPDMVLHSVKMVIV